MPDAAPADDGATGTRKDNGYEDTKEDDVPGLLFGSPDSVLSLEIHGFVNFEAYSFQHQSAQPKPSFDLHNFYFGLKTRIGQNLTVFGEVEHEHGASIKVDRAFVDWSPARWLTLRIGRFYVPFSYERYRYWAPARPMTSRPLLVDIPFHEWSDTGIELLGRYKWFGYDLAVVNGPQALTESGIAITDVRDNNFNKAIVARANVYPVTGLEAGLAYSQGSFDVADRLRFRMVEADARLTLGRFDVWMEYDRRFADNEPCAASLSTSCDPLFTGDPGDKQGYYVLASVAVVRDEKYIKFLKPIARFDSIESVSSGAGLRRITGGLNWSPVPHLQIRTEYQHTWEFGQAHLANDGMMGSVVADF